MIDTLRLYPRGTAVLFYSYGYDKGKNKVLNAWLIGIKQTSGRGPIAASSNGSNPTEESGDLIQEYGACFQVSKLERYVSTLQKALETDARRLAAEGRGAISRRRAPSRAVAGSTDATRRDGSRADESTSAIPLYEIISNVTSLLLPDKIEKVLFDNAHALRHLILVPALDLSLVPFAILKPYGTKYLIDSMSVSVAPSLFNVVGGAQSAQLWGSTFEAPLVVGNPVPLKDPYWVFESLPGAQSEAQVVAKLLKTQPLLTKAATKEEVVARAKHADLLYFATHGVADGSDPLKESFLAFASSDKGSGRWTMREIESDPLAARLTVLSACATGLGPKYEAGIMHLARTFQVAGVPRVIMSLWNVDDEATAELMPLFIEYLKTERPAEALRRAMLKIRETHPAPLHWAAFTLFGAP